ncbi:glycosyl transferase family 1 [Pseudoalteromonas sp. NEC-BIFX-2020_015]|uniref:glycosyltransferase n=1 Tax=Pseudoalteromonas sp. NEC-BIFX-2020_015 TaxID=2729544 RepID=UPI0014614447|nr:glycosyltransferase [Pseudoalteromonas sp. NEC-BIFX-2020_015]NMR26812.1 glycosyl transferase family 1 [Pseudoalteromonas sp. NEC-BIFX-2020_015]
MKVLLVAPIHSPIVKRLISALEGSGIELIIASHNAAKEVGVIDLGPCRSMFSYLCFWKINKLVKEHQPDVVHAHVLNHYGLMAAFQNRPLLVALWGSDVMLSTKAGAFITRKLFRVINWFVLKRADYIHTSGKHVAKEAESQCKGVKKKINTFYWGFPLPELELDVLNSTYQNLSDEFELTSEKNIVFPRGLGNVYNPEGAAKIINYLMTKGIKAKRIVVLRGFANEDCVRKFTSLVDIDKITFINRLLDPQELYALYKNTCMHFSIPHSDSLGGGVIEPALVGSLPVLSDLPSYRDFLKESKGLLLTEYTYKELDVIYNKITDDPNIESDLALSKLTSKYSLNSVVNNFNHIYKVMSDNESS